MAIDFENGRGVRVAPGEVNTDAINLGQFLELKNNLEKQIQTLASYISNLGENPLYISLVAGENLAQLDICFLHTDGKIYRANATTEADSSSLLVLCPKVTQSGDTVKCLQQGKFYFGGLSIGIYYLNTFDGGYTQTPPSSSGNIVRVVGYGLDTEYMLFNPDQSWVKIK